MHVGLHVFIHMCANTRVCFQKSCAHNRPDLSAAPSRNGSHNHKPFWFVYRQVYGHVLRHVYTYRHVYRRCRWEVCKQQLACDALSLLVATAGWPLAVAVMALVLIIFHCVSATPNLETFLFFVFVSATPNLETFD